jgi:hypothetical protein
MTDCLPGIIRGLAAIGVQRGAKMWTTSSDKHNYAESPSNAKDD